MSTTAFKTFSCSCPNSCKDIVDVKTMGIALSQHGGKFMTRQCTKIAKTCLPQPGLLRNRSLSSFSLQNVRVLVPLEPVQGHHFKPHFFLQITSLRTKRENNSFLKTLFCWARCQDNWKRSLWSFSIQNNRVLVPLEPGQGHHFKPNFFYKLQVWGHKGKQKYLWENPFCCARCQDNWKKSLWSFSLQNKRVLVPLEPLQGHHLKPNIWRHKGKQTHFEKTYSVGDLPKKIPQQVYFSVHLCASADPRKNRTKV